MLWATRIAVGFVALLGVAIPVGTTEAQESAVESSAVGQLLDAGEDSLRKGDYKKAIRVLTEALELSGNRSTRALFGIGSAYLRLSKPERAQEFGNKILELAEQEVERAAAENLIGSALLRQALDDDRGESRLETLGEAESHLRASLDVWSGQMTIAWSNLSVVLQEQDRLAEALEAQQQYVNRTPENRPAKVRLCGLRYLVAESAAEDSEGVVSIPVPREPEEPYWAKCVGVTDGDTITVLRGSEQIDIRLERIDCPETGDAISQQAKQFTSSLVLGKTVKIVPKNTDPYGRTVARVHVGDIDVGRALLAAGLAWHATEFSSDRELAQIESEAKAAGIGVWSEASPTRFEGEITPPERIHGPQPLYTAKAKRARIEGVVIMATSIDKGGNVSNVKVLKGLPLGLDKQAALAVCQSQYEPATLNGQPVKMTFNVLIRFRLE